ncbi:MAG: sporulation peptidase YabG [Bacilli bacterium]|jgi:spore coat assembly protein
MNFKIGDMVTRRSYNHDVIFKITDISEKIVFLKGVNVRLYADSVMEDLKIYDESLEKTFKDDKVFQENVQEYMKFNRDEYFYLPGRILHIDGDKEYLERCLKFYKEADILVYGKYEKEDQMALNIKNHLEEIQPDVVVITGHDAYYKKKGEKEELLAYKNTKNFINAIFEARKYEKSPDKLIIIAGACQSNYEELIKAGANFASSPRRINIHALDPAIIALALSLSDKSKEIDLLKILDKTKYGKNGLGGIITGGTMYIGYPR